MLGTLPELTRQSLSGCSSQPKHGPLTSQGRKKDVARPGLEAWPAHVTGGKRMWPDWDSNPGSLAYREHSTTELSFVIELHVEETQSRMDGNWPS